MRSWWDVRVMRGADVSSEHNLLVTACETVIKRNNINNNALKMFNVRLLRSKETKEAFNFSLSNQFQPLQKLIEDKEMAINTNWEHSATLWLDTCEEVLGKKTKHKEWISSNTIKKSEKRNEKKATLKMSQTRAATVKVQEAADR
jgi:hypothetical protein